MTTELAVLPEPPEAARAVQETAALAMQVGTIKLSPEQRAALQVHATPEIVEVRPTGELYVPGKFYRDVLNTVFGPGAWAVRHGNPMMDVQEKDYKSTLYLNVFLMAGRCTRCARSINACKCDGVVEQMCVAMAIGAQAYHPRNSRLSYDDALEGAITNGLMRCCAKQLGSYAECWDPRWAEETRAAVCVRVRVEERNGMAERWRRKDRLPLDGEQAAPKPRPVPSQEPVMKSSPSPAATGGGEVIGQIRSSGVTSTGAQYWTVVTDKGEYVTDEQNFVRDLETYKAQGKRIVFDIETVSTRGGGTKKKILEYRIA